MTVDMSQFYEVFFDESEELLAEAERLLLSLDIENPDSEELNAIFRAAHSIKGGAATFGFMDMTEITHVLENLLDKIRKNEMALTSEHVDAFLAAKDVLKMQLDGHRLATAVDLDQVAEIKAVLKALSEAGGIEVKAAPVAAPAPVAVVEAPLPVVAEPVQAEAAPADGLTRFNIALPEISEKDVANLQEELGLLGEVTSTKQENGRYVFKLVTDSSETDIISICSFIVDADDLVITSGTPANTGAAISAPADGLNRFSIVFPEITEKDVSNLQEELALLGEVTSSKQENGRYVFVLTTDSSQADIISICSFIVEPDDLVITLNPTEAAPVKAAIASAAEPAATAKTGAEKAGVEVAEEVGYGLFEMPGEDKVEEGYGFFAPFTPNKSAAPSNLIGDDTPVPPEVSNSVAATTPVAEVPVVERKNPGRRESDKAPASAETSSIRVGVEKVDQLINLVGELVITQAMIAQRISMLDPIDNEALVNSVSQLTRNTRDLQESVMSIRMMPMDFVFSRFPRMVRDLAAKLNKKVEFVTVGATTELDKGLIERIVDPLTHLVRNSVDHGIETPENRKAAGKTEMGRLTLSAAHKGGSIVIEVTDDGAGLNRDKLLAKAQKNGLQVSESMTDSEVFQLIFAPGFSTAEVVTDVSGRGVGMDVVKRNITAMGGSVEIRSALGYGTTMSISLPLTLAILDGMSVSLGQSLYVVPLNLIVETMQPRMEDIKTVTGQGLMIHVRGEYLPIIPLYALFNQDTEITHPTEGVLVILEAEGKKAALFVDGLVGQQQVVIKSLETNFKKIQGVSGATIMGDGSVALILDVPAIIKMGQYNNTQGVTQ